MPNFDVMVVGELNLDLILYGLPDELPPERELLADGLVLTLGSSSAIFAHNLSRLGRRVGFMSRIGDDPLGQIALDRLAAGGVDVSRVQRVSGWPSTGLTVILPRANFRNILTYPGTMNTMCFEDLDVDYLTSARHFHMSSYFLHRGLHAHMVDLFKKLKTSGMSISLDTNDDPSGQWDDNLIAVLRYVDVFLPNAHEAMKITRCDDLTTAVAQLAQWVPVVAVKLGDEGALVRCGKEEFRNPAVEIEVVDSVGAGDSFDAGFIHQYVGGGTLATSLAFGNLMGAFSTTRPGGTEAFRDQKGLDDFLTRHWTLRAEKNRETAGATEGANHD
ncbi:MAG: carbohydrate kinase family protein [Terriglobia bacterium]